MGVSKNMADDELKTWWIDYSFYSLMGVSSLEKSVAIIRNMFSFLLPYGSFGLEEALMQL